MRYPVDNWSAWYDAQPFGSKTSYGYHEAADINLKTGGDSDLGQPLYAIADGVVTSVHKHATSNNFGFHVHIKHDGAWGTVWCHFAHCSDILVSEGQVVKEGDLVARVGKSGTVYSHCHWAIKLQPTGIEGIAKTKDDLLKWTDPIQFVERWMQAPPPGKIYTEEKYQALKHENQDNWEKWQASEKNRQEDLQRYCRIVGCEYKESAFIARLEQLVKGDSSQEEVLKELKQQKENLEKENSELRRQIKILKQLVLDKQKELGVIVNRLNKILDDATMIEEKKEIIENVEEKLQPKPSKPWWWFW